MDETDWSRLLTCQAARSRAADRLHPWASLSRLCAVQTIAQSPRTLAKPRSRNWDVMNEIACSLDAENVRDAPEKRLGV
jgi:hypothetical protein